MFVPQENEREIHTLMTKRRRRKLTHSWCELGKDVFSAIASCSVPHECLLGCFLESEMRCWAAKGPPAEHHWDQSSRNVPSGLSDKSFNIYSPSCCSKPAWLSFFHGNISLKHHCHCQMTIPMVYTVYRLQDWVALISNNISFHAFHNWSWTTKHSVCENANEIWEFWWRAS